MSGPSSHQQIVELLLEKRGVKNSEQFFNPPYYDIQQRDPFKLAGVPQAVQRLVEARSANQKLVIYGDYDIDGLTATTLLHDAFTSFGFKVATYTPDRFSEGYGLNKDALSHIKRELGADLVVTVDCGTVSFAELEHAQSIGLEVIVTDHHQPKAELPPAVSIVNPHLTSSQYPFKDFAGVGVAFKLVQALQTQLDGIDGGQEKWLLDLVALGTVCDVVPLVDENRSLVYWGLKVMAQTRRVGLEELMAVSGVSPASVAAQDLGFRLGPRLNASGRLTHAKRSLALLMSQQRQEARQLAEELQALNHERRTIQQQVLDQAQQQAAADTNPVLVVSGQDWNEGVIGIVAAKLLETFQKPTFVFSIEGDKAKASARAYGDFSAVEAIRAADELLISGGGHQAAGGCTIAVSDLSDFKQIVNQYYRQLKLDLAQQRQLLKVSPDVSFDDSSLIDTKLLEALADFEPFGHSNPEPIIELRAKLVDQKLVGKQANHLKLRVEDSQARQLSGIMFGQSELLEEVQTVLGYLTATTYSQRGVELIVKDYT